MDAKELKDYGKLPKLPKMEVNVEDALRVVKKLRGLGGPSALSAYQLRRWIARYDESSERFRDSIARIIEYLGNDKAE